MIKNLNELTIKLYEINGYTFNSGITLTESVAMLVNSVNIIMGKTNECIDFINDFGGVMDEKLAEYIQDLIISGKLEEVLTKVALEEHLKAQQELAATYTKAIEESQDGYLKAIKEIADNDKQGSINSKYFPSVLGNEKEMNFPRNDRSLQGGCSDGLYVWYANYKDGENAIMRRVNILNREYIDVTLSNTVGFHFNGMTYNGEYVVCACHGTSSDLVHIYTKDMQFLREYRLEHTISNIAWDSEQKHYVCIDRTLIDQYVYYDKDFKLIKEVVGQQTGMTSNQDMLVYNDYLIRSVYNGTFNGFVVVNKHTLEIVQLIQLSENREVEFFSKVNDTQFVYGLNSVDHAVVFTTFGNGSSKVNNEVFGADFYPIDYQTRTFYCDRLTNVQFSDGTKANPYKNHFYLQWLLPKMYGTTHLYLENYSSATFIGLQGKVYIHANENTDKYMNLDLLSCSAEVIITGKINRLYVNACHSVFVNGVDFNGDNTGDYAIYSRISTLAVYGNTDIMGTYTTGAMYLDCSHVKLANNFVIASGKIVTVASTVHASSSLATALAPYMDKRTVLIS